MIAVVKFNGDFRTSIKLIIMLSDIISRRCILMKRQWRRRKDEKVEKKNQVFSFIDDVL